MSALVDMAEVQWGVETRFESLEVLEELSQSEDSSFESLVSNKRYERVEALRSLMTFEKLNGSLSNVMYSMRTAEIDFLAHQFVPVLKFVNSPLGRLLIADEVGLGKTIEAGLIWTECKARYKARRLLVVCPPTLVPKWIRELNNRFSINAEYVDAAGIKKAFDKFARIGPSTSFALVTSYHAMRPRRKERKLLSPWVRYHDTEVGYSSEEEPDSKWTDRAVFYRSLLEWEGKSPFLDLTVFDEAHMMKNTATANHFVGDVLSSSSQSVIALSATPLTTKTRDLYSLLKLVDPDMFHEEAVFNVLSKRNVPAIRLARELQKANIDRDECINLLEQIPKSSAKQSLLEEIQEAEDLTALPESRKIEMLGKANRLNELGMFLSRTRKIELNEQVAIREPVTLDVHPTEEELTLYNGVLALIRQRVAEAGRDLSIFHLIAPALTMTSCLPVMADRLKSGEFKWGDLNELSALDDAYSGGSSDMDFVGENQEKFSLSRDIVSTYDYEANDSKYSKLLENLIERSDDEKVIIFAFFKATLRYLERRLNEDGISCVLVTGDISEVEERDRLLRDFETESTRVLLCSEVVAEGVDLQFCRVVVNYDLPWNPMRVEQRIGRIDRIGQKADSIVIINFNVHGTIDGSIVSQLHHKIGLFQDNVGDLDGIMGDHVTSLTRELLSNELNAEQVDEKVRRTAQAIELEKTRIAEIDEESNSLLGLRSFLQSSVTSGQSLGRYIRPSELRLFADEFFADCYQGQSSCQLSWDTPDEECLTLVFSFDAMNDFEDYLNRNDHPWPRGFSRSSRKVEFTFDPAVHERIRSTNRKVIHINHVHPFVVWMIDSYQQQSREWHPASAVQVASDAVPQGAYLYLILRVILKHPTMSREELIFRVMNVDDGRALDSTVSESLVNEVIEHGTSWHISSGHLDYSDQLDKALDLVTQDCGAIHQSFLEDLEIRINTKRSQIKTHFDRQILTQERRLEGMIESGRARPQDITGTRTRLTNLMARREEELDQIDKETTVSPEFKRVACGIINVTT